MFPKIFSQINPLSVCCPHIETSQLICSVNQLTDFYMRTILALNGLSLLQNIYKQLLLRIFVIVQEQQASTWQSKYKKAVVDLEEAEERSEAAELALQKARQRARAGVSGAPTRGVSFALQKAHVDLVKFTEELVNSLCSDSDDIIQNQR